MTTGSGGCYLGGGAGGGGGGGPGRTRGWSRSRISGLSLVPGAAVERCPRCQRLLSSRCHRPQKRKALPSFTKEARLHLTKAPKCPDTWGASAVMNGAAGARAGRPGRCHVWTRLRCPEDGDRVVGRGNKGGVCVRGAAATGAASADAQWGGSKFQEDAVSHVGPPCQAAGPLTGPQSQRPPGAQAAAWISSLRCPRGMNQVHAAELGWAEQTSGSRTYCHRPSQLRPGSP